MRRSIEGPPGLFGWPWPRNFEPDQLPGPANHPWLVPKKRIALEILRIFKVRDGIRIEESLIKSQVFC